ncbi:MAG: hypothetical protein ACKOC5_10475 [Chloroflexota bacterium]
MKLMIFPSRPGANHAGYALREAVRQWGPLIRRGLRNFGNAKWKQPGWNRLRLRPSFRLREGLEGDRYVWWIEHDLPPVDLYHCAAYQVTLSRRKDGAMELIMHTGLRDRPIPQPVDSSLERVLEEALHDPARIIPRRMGAAYD